MVLAASSCGFTYLYRKSYPLSTIYFNIHQRKTLHYWFLQPNPSPPRQPSLKKNASIHDFFELVLGSNLMQKLLVGLLVQHWEGKETDKWSNMMETKTPKVFQFWIILRFLVEHPSKILGLCHYRRCQGPWKWFLDTWLTTVCVIGVGHCHHGVILWRMLASRSVSWFCWVLQFVEA